MRGQLPRLRISGVKNFCSSTSWSLEAMPVASKTRPLYVSLAGASLTFAMPSESSAETTAGPSRPLPPTATVPSTSGSPSDQRSSFTGLGRPRFLASSCPTGVWIRDW